MAHPFGGHPSLVEFLDFAVSQGCVTQKVVRATARGRTYVALVVTNPLGGTLTIPNPQFEERLSPSMVSQYHRRLGIKTPFAEKPESTSADAPTSSES
jgi:hypothetical protein